MENLQILVWILTIFSKIPGMTSVKEKIIMNAVYVAGLATQIHSRIAKVSQ